MQTTTPSAQREESNLIYKYTRTEAIDDGVLIDAPLAKLAADYGIKWHCAMTTKLFSKLRKVVESESNCADWEGTLWDMLTMFRSSVLRINPFTNKLAQPDMQIESGQRFPFRFLLANRRYQWVDAVFSIEELDGEIQPCWTFMDLETVTHKGRAHIVKRED